MRWVGAHVSAAGGLAMAVSRATDIGANCLQIFAGSPRSWVRKLYPSADTDVYRATAAAANIGPVFIHALYLINLGTDNPDLLRKSVDSLIFDLQNGQAINSAGVIVHLGSHQGRGFAAVSDQIAGVVQQIISVTEEMTSGHPEYSRGTPFIIENSAGQQGKIGSLSEIGELVNKISHPRVKVCLDSAHLFAAGYDLRQLSVADSLVNELVNHDLLRHVACLHLNDSKTELNSRNDQHANLGEGQIGPAGLANFVNHPEFAQLPIILEVPGETGLPDAKQIAIARSLTRSE